MSLLFSVEGRSFGPFMLFKFSRGQGSLPLRRHTFGSTSHTRKKKVACVCWSAILPCAQSNISDGTLFDNQSRITFCNGVRCFDRGTPSPRYDQPDRSELPCPVLPARSKRRSCETHFLTKRLFPFARYPCRTVRKCGILRRLF